MQLDPPLMQQQMLQQMSMGGGMGMQQPTPMLQRGLSGYGGMPAAGYPMGGGMAAQGGLGGVASPYGGYGGYQAAGMGMQPQY